VFNSIIKIDYNLEYKYFTKMNSKQSKFRLPLPVYVQSDKNCTVIEIIDAR